MKLSVITATYNAMGHLPDLVESLRSQVDKDFEWVVADGVSNDGTVDYLKKLTGLNVKIIDGPDFGIYDALNKAIISSNSDYYVVVGSDDFLYPDAVLRFKEAISSDCQRDLVAFPVKYSGRVVLPKNKWPWLYGQFTYISMHSVGLLIKKELHDNYGYYSRKYPIAADQYFILKAIRGGAKICFNNILVGEHGSDGVSGTDHLGVITEFYRVQVSVGFKRLSQTVLCCARLFKYVFSR